MSRHTLAPSKGTHMRTRGASIAACLTTSALLLSACGGGGDSGGSGGSADGPITLTFQSLSDQQAAIEATNSIVDAWNAENPDVQVKVIQSPWDGVLEKLTTQFSGDSAPDIVHADAGTILSFAQDGYLADLSDGMDPAFKDDVTGEVLDTVTVDGQVIAYPTELQTYMVFANEQMLTDAGVEIPTGETMTWEQYREIAKATTSDDTYGVAWGLSSPTATIMSMAPQFGGTYFEGTGEEATLTIGEGEQGVPEQIHAMAYEDGTILPVSLTQKGSEALAAFTGGKVAMTVQGSFQASNIAAEAPEGFDWIALPPLEGSEGAGQVANPQTLSVNVDSQYVDESIEFLNFFTSTENLAALNEADSLIPATVSAQDVLREKLADQPGWDVILDSGQYLEAGPFLFVTQYAAWKDTIATPAYQKFLANEIDADALADELGKGWDQMTK